MSTEFDFKNILNKWKSLEENNIKNNLTTVKKNIQPVTDIKPEQKSVDKKDQNKPIKPKDRLMIEIVKDKSTTIKKSIKIDQPNKINLKEPSIKTKTDDTKIVTKKKIKPIAKTGDNNNIKENDKKTKPFVKTGDKENVKKIKPK